MFLKVLLLLLNIHHAAATSPQSTTSKSSVKPDSTCPSRTVNYITHRLPQQCLTSSRNGSVQLTSVVDHIASTASAITTLPTSTSHSSTESYSTVRTTSPGHHDTNDQSNKSISVSTASVAVTTVIATSLPDASAVAILSEISDDESPLGGDNFLSFEEWRRQNLVKAGQSEHVGKETKSGARDGRKRPSTVHNSLDSLGDDVEIDLDFSGLVPGGPENIKSQASGQAASDQNLEDSDTKPRARSRSKDAGTTCKERFNYASFDCAANVLKVNSQAKSPTSVLVENKDAYMLNECSANNKFLILELCDDILIDTIVLANFEFFSSIFRQFRVSVSDRYPVKTDKWTSLGVFEARNTREVQAFLVENPIIWARYVRIEFLSHYGNEYYCPVSLVRVHGTTMMEEYKHDLDGSMGDDDDDDDDEQSDEYTESTMTQTTAEDRYAPSTADQASPSKLSQVVEMIQEHDTGENFHDTTHVSVDRSGSQSTTAVSDLNQPHYYTPISPNIVLAVQSVLASGVTPAVCSIDENPQQNNELQQDQRIEETVHKVPSAESTVSASDTTHASTTTSVSEGLGSPSDQDQGRVNSDASLSLHAATIPAESIEQLASTSVHNSKDATASNARLPSSSGTERAKHSASATQSHSASPTTQESFFKSVQKKLQMLESNSSLSLQYIEEQSRSLREAFRKVEQRQLIKTSTFLEQLNTTVLNELREFRQQYDQLWQSTVIELELQREQYQRENQAMHARLGVLADELIFQKRMSILQMTLILVCLGLVLFSRGAIHNYLELPIVQSVLSRSPGTRWTSLSGDTPSNSPQLTRARSAHQLRAKSGILKGHNRIQSDESNTAASDTMSPTEIYSPPTPVSFEGFSDVEHSRDGISATEDPEFDPSTIERPSTSPPVLRGTDELSNHNLDDFLNGDTIDTRLLDSPVDRGPVTPSVKLEESTPPAKHLKWAVPEA